MLNHSTGGAAPIPGAGYTLSSDGSVCVPIIPRNQLQQFVYTCNGCQKTSQDLRAMPIVQLFAACRAFVAFDAIMQLQSRAVALC